MYNSLGLLINKTRTPPSSIDPEAPARLAPRCSNKKVRVGWKCDLVPLDHGNPKVPPNSPPPKKRPVLRWKPKVMKVCFR